MEVQALTLNAILELLRERAAERQNSILIQARIVVSPDGAQLLDVHQEGDITTISY
jgi:hypothetical protein